jgi:hypothetical protein
MGRAHSAHPPVVRVSRRAQAELRASEALVFDWTSLAFCCATAGEISLRPTTLISAQHSPAYLPLRTGDGPTVFAHRRLPNAGRARHRGRLPAPPRPPLVLLLATPDLGLRTSFGRESRADRPDRSASGADAPLN